MRLFTAFLLTALTASAEFLHIEVTFEDIGCASCVESMQGRLARIRGVAQVEVNAGKGIATLELTPGNQVRMAPLLARVTQDGTKVTAVAVSAKGAIEAQGSALLFHSAGLTEAYSLRFGEGVAKPKPGANLTVRGTVPDLEPGAAPVLVVTSIKMDGSN